MTLVINLIKLILLNTIQLNDINSNFMSFCLMTWLQARSLELWSTEWAYFRNSIPRVSPDKAKHCTVKWEKTDFCLNFNAQRYFRSIVNVPTVFLPQHYIEVISGVDGIGRFWVGRSSNSLHLIKPIFRCVTVYARLSCRSSLASVSHQGWRITA